MQTRFEEVSNRNRGRIARKTLASLMAIVIAVTSMPAGAFAQGATPAPRIAQAPAAPAPGVGGSGSGMALPPGVGPGGSLAATTTQATYAAPEKPSMKKTYNVPGGGGGVNLFTGEVSFSVPLAAIGGRNGLGFTLNASYSSNVLRSVVQWNGDEPTGYLGLGWTLETPRIVVDTKNSGRTQDDVYYLQLGGNKQRLMLDPNQPQSDTVLNFRTQQWSAWKIQFSPVNNGADGKWVLTDENGLTYKFDGSSVAGGVQWGVRWDNWIGPTRYGSANDGATNFAVVYNLTSIEEPWGDKLTFGWTQENQHIGASGNLQYGRENRLVSVTSASMGTKMVLKYENKSSDSTHQEYVNPHKTSGNVSYYQDQFETKYLAAVENYRNITSSNINGDLASYTKFTFGWVNVTGSEGNPAPAYAKRLLTAIATSEANSELPVTPPTTYKYFDNGAEKDKIKRDLLGALQSVTTPSGGTITYSYATQLPAQSSVKYDEQRPGAAYTKQRTWYGEDYTVTMWANVTGPGNQATVQFHTNDWQGRWVGYHSDDIVVSDWTAVQLETSRDFYAAMFTDPSSNILKLRLARRIANGWSSVVQNISVGVTGGSLGAGDNFAVVAFIIGGQSADYVARWNGSTWEARTGSYGGTPSARLARGRNDFYISADYTSTLRARLVTISREGWPTYLSPSWSAPITDSANAFDLELGSSFGFLRGGRYQTSSSTHWYGYAIRPGLGSDGSMARVDVSEGAKTWFWPLHIVDSTVGMGLRILQMLPPSKTLTAYTTVDHYTSDTQAYTTPYVYMPEAIRNGISLYYTFWLSVWAYDPASESWVGQSALDENNKTNGPVSAQREFFYANNNGGQPVAEVRNPNGTWSISASIPGTKAWIAARDRMLVSADPGYDKIRFAPHDGNLTQGSQSDYSPPAGNTYVSDDPYAIARSGRRTIGPNTVASWPINDKQTFENASKVTLERTYNYSGVPNFPGPYTTPPAYFQASVVVSQIVASTGYENTANAGLPSKTVRFTFDPSTATMDPTGRYARYNKVTVSNGAGGTASTSDHYGETEYYFYNGLNPANYDGQGTSLPNWGTSYNPNPGNEATYYRYLDGMPYYAANYLESYTGSAWIRTLKSTSATSYNVVEKNMAALQPAYYVQPTYAVAYSDGAVVNGQLTGAKTETRWGYYQASEGVFETFVKNVQVSRINANGIAETTDKTYTYAGQVAQYAAMLTGNYLARVAQVRASKVGQDPANPGQTCVYAQNPAVACTILGVGATTYKEWTTGRWGPVTGYSWNRGASSSSFNFASPNADWLQGAEITTVNAAGLVTEMKYSYGTAAGGPANQQTTLYSSILYDSQNRFPVASFSDARSSGDYRNAGYIGLEDYERPNNTSAFPGWTIGSSSAVPTTTGANHAGIRVLASNATGDMLTSTFSKDPAENRGIQVASLYAQIPSGRTLTLKLEAMNGSTVSQTYTREILGTSASAITWQYVEIAGQWGSGLGTMRFTASVNGSGVRIDDIRFGSASAPFSAQIVNDAKGLVTATLGHNGEVGRVIYDQFDSPMITAGPTEATTSTGWKYFSRFAAGRSFDPDNPQIFKPDDPNAMGAIVGMDSGAYDDFRNGNSKWTCSDSVSNNCAITQDKGDFVMTVRTTATLRADASKNIAVRTRIDKPASSFVSINAASWQVVYVTSQNRYEFWHRSGSTLTAIGSVAAAFSSDWMLVAIDNQFYFLADGKLLFTNSASNGSPRAPAFQEGFENEPITVRAFATYLNPALAMQFIDGAGRTIQSTRAFGDRNAKVAGVLYNSNWDRTVAAKAIDYPADNTRNGLYFRQGYVGRDASDKLVGDVTSYYGQTAATNNGYTNDGGFPFWGGANRKEPADRAATRGQPGTTYNTEAAGAPKVASFDYGVNQGGASDATSTNLLDSSRAQFSDNAFLRSKGTTPNGASGQSFATATGGGVGSVFLGATTYGQGAQNIQTLKTVDAYGRTDAIYHPNYFPSQQDQRDAFKASVTYDNYDRAVSMTTVDSGTSKVVYNKIGQLRYWADPNSIAAGRVSYARYDKYGRLIEAGQVPGSITDPALQTSAEDISQPANTDASWRLRYVYDRGAFGQTQAEAVNINFYSKGRLIAVQTRNSPDEGNQFSSQAFVYNERGQVNAVYEEYKPYGVGQITGYAYNNLGMPTKIVYPQPVGSTALLAGTCSAPTPSVVNQPVVAQVNSNLQNNVWSFSDYVRAALNWVPSWGSSNAQTVLKEDLLRSRLGAGGDASCANADPTVTILVAGLLLGLRSTSYTQNAPVAVTINSNASPDSGLDIYGEASFYNELTVTRVVAANAPTVTYSYNRLGQLTQIGNETDAAHYATYSYGPNGEILSENRYRDPRNGDMHYSYTYRYDSLGRPISTALKYAGSSSVDYWQENLSYETGPTPNYDSKITRITGCQWNGNTGSGSSCTTYDRSFTYLPEGALLAATDQAYSYLNYGLTRKDASSNLTATKQGYQPSAGTGAVADFTYAYQPGTNRVVSVSGPVEGTIAYTYDANGNVTSKSRHIASAEYDPFSNRVTKVVQANPNNSPVEGSYNLRYGGLLGERVSSTYQDASNNQITESVYFRGLGYKPLTILRQPKPSGATGATTNYPVSYKHMVYGPKGIVAMVAQDADSVGSYTTTEYWPVQNYQGSVVSVYKEPTNGGNATSMAQFQYSATGNIYALNTSTGRFQPYYDQEPLVPYLFQGQEYDWQAQLHNFNARLYDSQTLTFLQPDPRFSAGMGSYVGLGNDPVNMVDPDGRAMTHVIGNQFWILVGAYVLAQISLMVGHASLVGISMIASIAAEFNFWRTGTNGIIGAEMFSPFGLYMMMRTLVLNFGFWALLDYLNPFTGDVVTHAGNSRDAERMGVALVDVSSYNYGEFAQGHIRPWVFEDGMRQDAAGRYVPQGAFPPFRISGVGILQNRASAWFLDARVAVFMKQVEMLMAHAKGGPMQYNTYPLQAFLEHLRETAGMNFGHLFRFAGLEMQNFLSLYNRWFMYGKGSIVITWAFYYSGRLAGFYNFDPRYNSPTGALYNHTPGQKVGDIVYRQIFIGLWFSVHGVPQLGQAAEFAGNVDYANRGIERRYDLIEAGVEGLSWTALCCGVRNNYLP
jgi:RHS repeat-associated protein